MHRLSIHHPLPMSSSPSPWPSAVTWDLLQEGTASLLPRMVPWWDQRLGIAAVHPAVGSSCQQHVDHNPGRAARPWGMEAEGWDETTQGAPGKGGEQEERWEGETPAAITCNGDVQGGFLPAYPIAGVAGVAAAVRLLRRSQVQNAEALGEAETSVWGKGLPIFLPGNGVHPALCHIAEHLAGGPGHEDTGPQPRARHGLWRGDRNTSTSLRHDLEHPRWGSGLQLSLQHPWGCSGAVAGASPGKSCPGQGCSAFQVWGGFFSN